VQVVLVSLGWFRRNSLLKCISQPKIAKNSFKTPLFGVPSRSRSSMLVPLESSSAVLVMMRSKSVSVCNCTHARRANIGQYLPVLLSRVKNGSVNVAMLCIVLADNAAVIRVASVQLVPAGRSITFCPDDVLHKTLTAKRTDASPKTR